MIGEQAPKLLESVTVLRLFGDSHATVTESLEGMRQIEEQCDQTFVFLQQFPPRIVRRRGRSPMVTT